MKIKHVALIFCLALLSFLSSPLLSKDKPRKISETQKAGPANQTPHAESVKIPTHKSRLWDYKKKHFNLYSVQSEIDMGTKYQAKQIQSFRQKNKKVNPADKAALKKRIENIVKRIAKVSDMPHLPYEVHLYDDPEVVNAFCMPGGKIGVFTGLFHKEKGLVDINSDDEIAAVMSHEIAHATMRHVTRRLTTMQGAGVLSNVVSIGVGKSVGGNWARFTDQIFNTGAALYFPGYSRKHETEADKVGLYYMTKAGFDPKAAVRIWQRAASRNKKGGQTSQFFATHPANGERARYLQGYLPDTEVVKKKSSLIESMKK